MRRCAECSGRRIAFASARAAIAYEGVGQRFVGAWKEAGRRDLAGVAAEIVVGVVPRPAVDGVTFVPGDPERRRRRGHVPAGRLADELARRWDLPVDGLLRRTRAVQPQRGLSLTERRRNVAGAFACESAAARLCLVDDVYTTGATASACASALRRGGARHVDVVSLARALR